MNKKNNKIFEKKILAQYLVPKYFLRFKFGKTRPVYGVDTGSNVLHYFNKTKQILGQSFVSKAGLLKHSNNGMLKIPCILPVTKINQETALIKLEKTLSTMQVQNSAFRKLFLLNPVRGGYLACSNGIFGYLPDYDLSNFLARTRDTNTFVYKLNYKMKNISCVSDIASDQIRLQRNLYSGDFEMKRTFNIIFSISQCLTGDYSNEVGSFVTKMERKSGGLLRHLSFLFLKNKKAYFKKTRKKTKSIELSKKKLILLSVLFYKQTKLRNFKFARLIYYTYNKLNYKLLLEQALTSSRKFSKK